MSEHNNRPHWLHPDQRKGALATLGAGAPPAALERALEHIMAIASYTPMQTEIQTAGQMGRIMRVAEEALAAHRAATAPSGPRSDAPEACHE